MNRKVGLFLLLIVLASAAFAQVRIAQLSDLHIGAPASTAPHAVDNLRQAVQIINAQEVMWSLSPATSVRIRRHGLRPAASSASSRRRSITSPAITISTPMILIVTAGYSVKTSAAQVKNVLIYGFDSSVLGDYDSYNAAKLTLPPPSQQATQNKVQMLNWMRSSATPAPPAARS